MSELTLKLDYEYLLNEEFITYILSQNGVLEVKIDKENDEIYLKYDAKIISLEGLNYEINFFLDILNIPSLLSFDKHSINKTTKYIMKIEDICCEYCLKGMIAELLETKGIEKINTNYNEYDQWEDILFYIEYDETLISKDAILELEKKI